MTFRRVLTLSLLLFVAVSAITLIGKELTRNRSVPVAANRISGATSSKGRQIVAYYFLGKVRCSSCRKIEEVSRRTIEESFRRELDDSRLQFLVVNVDQPENRQFIEKYRLESSSLVLVEMQAGKPVAWKNLQDVWTLVEDEPRLAKYVRDEVATKLREI